MLGSRLVWLHAVDLLSLIYLVRRTIPAWFIANWSTLWILWSCKHRWEVGDQIPSTKHHKANNVSGFAWSITWGDAHMKRSTKSGQCSQWLSIKTWAASGGTAQWTHLTWLCSKDVMGNIGRSCIECHSRSGNPLHKNCTTLNNFNFSQFCEESFAHFWYNSLDSTHSTP